jgi:hypothetical protein
MTPDSIIAKIKALLRLTKSSNPHEAGLALQRAMELADKWHIDLAQLGDGEDATRLQHRHAPTPSRLSREWKLALEVAINYFNVHIIVRTGRSKILLTGTTMDIELGEYVITFLVRTCRQHLGKWKQAEKAARRKTTGPKVGAYVDGWFYGIRRQLNLQRTATEDTNPGLALALSTGHEARKAAATEFLGGPIRTITVPEAKRNVRALGAGFADGMETTIRPGLKGQELPQLA